MKINQIYRILLLSCTVLFQCNPIVAMSYIEEELVREGIKIKDDISRLQNEIAQIKRSGGSSSGSSYTFSSGTWNNPLIMEMKQTSRSILDDLNELLVEKYKKYQQWRKDNPKEAEEYDKKQTKGFLRAQDVASTSARFFGDLAYDITKEQSPVSRVGNIAYAGLLAATIPATMLLIKKGTDVALDVIKYKLTTPAITILRPETKYGRMDRIKRWWNSYKTPPMIFDESVKSRLEEIEVATKNIRDHIQKGTKKDVKYRNLLLYGKPGTGKTLFATILADKTDMDFLSVSAGDLLQSGAEGKKYFDDLVEMANRSKYGTILFIDEADGLFIDRDTLLKSKAVDHLIVLNHILGATGTGSNKYMLIAATNNAYSLDPAMGRRFQDRVEMPLPNQATRVELLNLNIKNKLSNATALLTPEKIVTIATRTEGLSHAEISDMVNAMSTKADTNKDGRLTERNIESAIVEAIEKMKAAEKDKLELERKIQGTPATT